MTESPTPSRTAESGVGAGAAAPEVGISVSTVEARGVNGAATSGAGAGGGDDVDVVIVGAGLSGIGAAYRIQEANPDASYVLLEGRHELGGTWSLFRYPGVRSDSDMYTLAYPFEPWPGRKAIADGADILAYLRATAEKYGIDEHIRYDHRVVGADWSSEDARWTVRVSTPEGERVVRTRFIYACSGYYSYDRPYEADIPGLASFAGEVVHPQHWPDDLDVAGRRVVVIGSGATGVTLLPALDAAGAKVTMLQRTPTYVVNQPARDPLAALLDALPVRMSAQRRNSVLRKKNIGVQWGSYQFARRAPKLARKALQSGVRAFAGAEHVPSFTAPYDPWDQRLCVVPDGDLFKALKRGAQVVTDTIEVVEPHGIRLASGRMLDADVIVTATGLSIELLGGAQLSVDGEPVDLSSRLAYRGCMLEGVPNAAMCVGYLNASWGLRSDLSNTFVARMIKRMRDEGLDAVVPTPPSGLDRRPLLEMDSGYLRRAASLMPRRSSSTPWTMRQDYLAEVREMRGADLTVDITDVRRAS